MNIYSLNIGVAYTDEDHYGNDLIQLPCCINDAESMHKLGHFLNYKESTLLLNENATVSNVEKEIIRYSKIAKKDDLVIVYYSGHGSNAADLNFDESIEIGLDQTLCLYDRQFIDDEFRYLWKEFEEGVNVLLIADSCYSGTVFKNTRNFELEFTDSYDYSNVVKSITDNKALNIIQRNIDLYRPIMIQPIINESEIKCSVLGISACQDKQEALAGVYLSFFTRILIATLVKEADKIKNYESLFGILRKISKKEESITPNLEYFGKSTNFFKNTKPFLKPKDNYPEELLSFYQNIFLNSDSVVNKGLNDNGLIVDILNKTEDEFVKFVTPSDISTITKSESMFLVFDDKITKSSSHPWDRAYLLYEKLKKEGISAYIEPDLIPLTEENEAKSEDINLENETADNEANPYLKNWPNPPIGTYNEFTWHLGDSHSQLRSALKHLKERLPEKELNIKIGQIDTGYSPNHPAIPENILEGMSFVKGEEGMPAYDEFTDKKIEQQDHGTATACILAGKKVPEELAYGEGSNQIGAIPFATVYPMRISETVALSALLGNTTPFVKAIKKAIEEKCEVVTMSMGGLPTRAWAKVINKAYEAGITVVTAGGNSWVKGWGQLAPKKLLYPARFRRVIAAVGVCYNHYPYVAKANPAYGNSNSEENGEIMQGNYYPRSAMKTAIAAYTPNIPWCRVIYKKESNEGKPIIERNGAGTSSATPQVAAAAAMWITKNKKELIEKGYYGTWKQVEAVRYALFKSARKRNIFEWNKYYGHGILQAKDALDIEVPELERLKKSPKARILFGVLKYIQLLLLRKSTDDIEESTDDLKKEMIFQEILQVMEQDPKLQEMYKEVDLHEMAENDELSLEQFREICYQVSKSPYSSGYFKRNVRV